MLAVVISVIIGVAIIIKKFNVKVSGGSDGTERARIQSNESGETSKRG